MTLHEIAGKMNHLAPKAGKTVQTIANRLATVPIKQKGDSVDVEALRDVANKLITLAKGQMPANDTVADAGNATAEGDAALAESEGEGATGAEGEGATGAEGEGSESEGSESEGGSEGSESEGEGATNEEHKDLWMKIRALEKRVHKAQKNPMGGAMEDGDPDVSAGVDADGSESEGESEGEGSESEGESGEGGESATGGSESESESSGAESESASESEADKEQKQKEKELEDRIEKLEGKKKKKGSKKIAEIREATCSSGGKTC